MTPKEVKGSGYQKPESEAGLSEKGRAFLEALARRKRAKGEEVPPLYQKLLEVPLGELGEREEPGVPPPSPVPWPGEGAVRAEALRPLPEAALGVGALGAEPPLPKMRPSVFQLVDRALQAHPEATEGLSPTAFRAYRLLLAAGLELLTRRLGDRPIPKNLSQVTAFGVNRALALALGVSEATLYRALVELKERGLVVRRGWMTPATVKGRPGIYTAGAVYAVRLPHRSGRPRLEREDFTHPWRDLEGDIKEGKTAWRAAKLALRECNIRSPKEDHEALEFLLGFALSPGERSETALDLHSLRVSLRAAKGKEKRLLVAKIALGLAHEFKDPGSVRFYAWVIWGALRAELYGMREGALDLVAWALERVREAVLTALWGSRKGGIRRPGALLAHLLKEQGLLPLLQQAPQWRVA